MTRQEGRSILNRTSAPYPSTTCFSECPECGGRGIRLAWTAEGDPVAHRCECHGQSRIERLIKLSGLTGDQRRVTLDTFRPGRETRMMYQVVRSYLRDWPKLAVDQGTAKGFALYGSVGAGKTHLALAAANWLLDRRVPVVYVTTPDLMAELLVSQREGGEDLEGKIRLLSTAQVVIFDDLAKEKITEWVQTQYFRIVDGRYRRGLATCWTSNLGVAELAERLGDATASRLYALTRGRQVAVNAPDFRLVGLAGMDAR